MLNKKEFIKKISDETEMSGKEIEKVINANFNTISDEIEKEEKVAIWNFGIFEPKLIKERKGRNPATGEELLIPESRTVKFKAGKSFKDRLNK